MDERRFLMQPDKWFQLEDKEKHFMDWVKSWIVKVRSNMIRSKSGYMVPDKNVRRKPHDNRSARKRKTAGKNWASEQKRSGKKVAWGKQAFLLLQLNIDLSKTFKRILQ